jgi:hypothetical protein
MIWKTAKKVISDKGIFRTFDGCLGQLRLFLYSSYRNAISEKIESAGVDPILIHKHFAVSLDAFDRDITIDEAGQWKAQAIFPDIQHDVLMYLILMGCPRQPCFMLNVETRNDKLLTSALKRVPIRVFELAKNNARCVRQSAPGYQGPQAVNDGMKLEAITAGAICVASHMGGVGGILFLDFLKQLVYELSFPDEYTIDSPRDINFGYDFATGGLCHSFCNIRIPFLSPPNQIWPKYLNLIRGVLVGNMKRTLNKDGCDVRFDNFTIECKDRADSIDSSELKKIIKKVTSAVNVVVVNKLQKSYFQSTGDKEGKPHNWNNHGRHVWIEI